MITIILIAILICFIQVSWWPVNLVMLFLVARSFIVSDNANYYMAFGVGILMSILTDLRLGVMSIIFLFGVELTHILRRTRIINNWLFILPVGIFMAIFTEVALSFLERRSIVIWPTFLQGFLVLPFWVFLKIWEERFVARKDVRLKIRR